MDVTIIKLGFDQIAFKESNAAIRAACKTPFRNHPNGCDNFGKTWGCPPHAPDLSNFKQKLNGFNHFYFIILEMALITGYDQNVLALRRTRKAYKLLNSKLVSILNSLKARNQPLLVIQGEGCEYCKRNGLGDCTCPQLPCRYPQELTYSLSVAFDTFATLEKAGISIQADPTTRLFRIGFVASRDELSLERFFDDADYSWFDKQDGDFSKGKLDIVYLD
ncbi:hypothetical protein GF325_19105 [Candidatus Bathyarchaeota archaeon]|nr:hypothetical protein [Candidatus Bathyarchaeota archaeon]